MATPELVTLTCLTEAYNSTDPESGRAIAARKGADVTVSAGKAEQMRRDFPAWFADATPPKTAPKPATRPAEPKTPAEPDTRPAAPQQRPAAPETRDSAPTAEPKASRSTSGRTRKPRKPRPASKE